MALPDSHAPSPPPSVSPESQHVEIHGSFTGQGGGAASGGRGAMQAGQGLWLLTWRPRHVAAPSTDGAFPGSLRLLWRASLHQPTARVPLLLELWGAVSAMLEGEVGGPRSKSCQGFGAKAGVRSSFFGKVGFGGRGADLAGFSPGRADGEAGPAAACALLLGKLKHTWGGVGGGASGAAQEGPPPCPLQPAASLWGPLFQPLGLPGAASLVPFQLGGWLPTLPPGPCSGCRVEGLGLGTLLFPRRS